MRRKTRLNAEETNDLTFSDSPIHVAGGLGYLKSALVDIEELITKTEGKERAILATTHKRLIEASPYALPLNISTIELKIEFSLSALALPHEPVIALEFPSVGWDGARSEFLLLVSTSHEWLKHCNRSHMAEYAPGLLSMVLLTRPCGGQWALANHMFWFCPNDIKTEHNGKRSLFSSLFGWDYTNERDNKADAQNFDDEEEHLYFTVLLQEVFMQMLNPVTAFLFSTNGSKMVVRR